MYGRDHQFELRCLLDDYKLAEHTHTMIRVALDLHPDLHPDFYNRTQLSWRALEKAAENSLHVLGELRESLRSMLSDPLSALLSEPVPLDGLDGEIHRPGLVSLRRLDGGKWELLSICGLETSDMKNFIYDKKLAGVLESIIHEAMTGQDNKKRKL